jgi:hypothetical protein
MKSENHKKILDATKKANELIKDLYAYPEIGEGADSNKVCSYALKINQELLKILVVLDQNRKSDI